MERRRKIRIGNRPNQTNTVQNPANELAPRTALPKRPLPFEQRYTRITTYLENELSDRIHDLNSNRVIPSLTAVLNAALREYLDLYHPES